MGQEVAVATKGGNRRERDKNVFSIATRHGGSAGDQWRGVPVEGRIERGDQCRVRGKMRSWKKEEKEPKREKKKGRGGRRGWEILNHFYG